MANGTALVTGASGGIGMEIARVLSREGYRVVLVARRREELERLAAELGNALVCTADLTKREAADDVLAWCVKEKLEIDVLVNNAGFGSAGFFADLDTKRELDMVQVNCGALVHFTRLFLTPMLARKRGRILNVGSTAGFQPGPFMAVYYATKAFVNSFSEALSVELQGTGVSCTVLCPGPTETGFVAAAKMEGSALFKMLAVSNAKSVAEDGVRGMLRGKAIVVPGVTNKLAIQANRVSPRALVRAMTGRMNRVRKHQDV